MKKNLIYIILLWLLMFFWTSFAENLPSCVKDISALSNSLNPVLSNKNASSRLIVQNFCTYVYNRKCIDNSLWEDLDYFDANQSVFLSLLCDNFGVGEKFKSIERNELTSIIKKKTFEDFGMLGLDEDQSIYCNSKSSIMNDCRLHNHIPELFNEILADYFNIWQSKIYGIDIMEDVTNLDSLANTFSNKYFGMQICWVKPWYSKSCVHLKNYMKQANNLLKKTKVLDVKKLLDVNQETDCDEDSFSKNMLYCGLLWDNSPFADEFVNLVYNEYLWYRIFTSYYSNALLQVPGMSSLNTSFDVDKLADNKDKMNVLQEQSLKIQFAIIKSLRSLSEIYASFPTHIGLTMYQEDANMFMKELSKIYSPIRTLFDKFRNVQKTD